MMKFPVAVLMLFAMGCGPVEQRETRVLPESSEKRADNDSNGARSNEPSKSNGETHGISETNAGEVKVESDVDGNVVDPVEKLDAQMESAIEGVLARDDSLGPDGDEIRRLVMKVPFGERLRYLEQFEFVLTDPEMRRASAANKIGAARILQHTNSSDRDEMARDLPKLMGAVSQLGEQRERLVLSAAPTRAFFVAESLLVMAQGGAGDKAALANIFNGDRDTKRLGRVTQMLLNFCGAAQGPEQDSLALAWRDLIALAPTEITFPILEKLADWNIDDRVVAAQQWLVILRGGVHSFYENLVQQHMLGLSQHDASIWLAGLSAARPDFKGASDFFFEAFYKLISDSSESEALVILSVVASDWFDNRWAALKAIVGLEQSQRIRAIEKARSNQQWSGMSADLFEALALASEFDIDDVRNLSAADSTTAAWLLGALRTSPPEDRHACVSAADLLLEEVDRTLPTSALAQVPVPEGCHFVLVASHVRPRHSGSDFLADLARWDPAIRNLLLRHGENKERIDLAWADLIHGEQVGPFVAAIKLVPTTVPITRADLIVWAAYMPEVRLPMLSDLSLAVRRHPGLSRERLGLILGWVEHVHDSKRGALCQDLADSGLLDGKVEDLRAWLQHSRFAS